MRSKFVIPSLAAVIILGSISITPGDVLAKNVTIKITPPKNEDVNDATRLKTYPYHETEFERVNEKLTFMAYDKKTSASKETFFVDNGSDVSLTMIEIEISYVNEAGKVIHRRVVELSEEFPAKETRRVDIPTWDTQKSFHYVNSVPSKKGSTPYTVRFKVLSFIENGEE